LALLQRVMLEFFPQLLSLAQLLLRQASEAVQEAGTELYCCLFKHFTEPYNQQVGQGLGRAVQAVMWGMSGKAGRLDG